MPPPQNEYIAAVILEGRQWTRERRQRWVGQSRPKVVIGDRGGECPPHRRGHLARQKTIRRLRAKLEYLPATISSEVILSPVCYPPTKPVC